MVVCEGRYRALTSGVGCDGSGWGVVQTRALRFRKGEGIVPLLAPWIEEVGACGVAGADDIVVEAGSAVQFAEREGGESLGVMSGIGYEDWVVGCWVESMGGMSVMVLRGFESYYCV